MDPAVVDFILKLGLPTAAAVYIFRLYHVMMEKHIASIEQNAKDRIAEWRDRAIKAEDSVDRIRGVVDKQVEAQHSMILAQAAIINERRQGGGS